MGEGHFKIKVSSLNLCLLLLANERLVHALVLFFRILFSSGGHTRGSDGGVTMYLKEGVLDFFVFENKVKHNYWKGSLPQNCIDTWCYIAAVWHPSTGLQVKLFTNRQFSY